MSNKLIRIENKVDYVAIRKKVIKNLSDALLLEMYKKKQHPDYLIALIDRYRKKIYKIFKNERLRKLYYKDCFQDIIVGVLNSLMNDIKIRDFKKYLNAICKYNIYRYKKIQDEIQIADAILYKEHDKVESQEILDKVKTLIYSLPVCKYRNILAVKYLEKLTDYQCTDVLGYKNVHTFRTKLYKARKFLRNIYADKQ